jgi:transposase
MLEEIMFPDEWQVQLDGYVLENPQFIFAAHLNSTQAPCTYCGCYCCRVHSHYTRQLKDLPLENQPVQLSLTVRRFFCDNPSCPHRTFAEQVPPLAGFGQRRTVRQYCLLQNLALALGGELGARNLRKMGIEISPDTLLRIMDKLPIATRPTPRVLGMDEWAIRKGHNYGTVLVDLERHKLVELLPDDKAESFAKWLVSHPGVEIISRDRDGSFANGARRGAPEAIQVADRFHLLVNLGDYLKQIFERKRACLYPSPAPEKANSASEAVEASVKRQEAEIPSQGSILVQEETAVPEL